MSKKQSQGFFIPGGEFVIPSRMLPKPIGGMSVRDICASIEPRDREAIARAYRAFMRGGGA